MLSNKMNRLTIIAIILSLSVHFINGESDTSPNSHQEEANARAETGALQLIANIPRYGTDRTMDKEDLHGLNDYWYGVGSLVAVPAGFVVLSLLIAPFWMLCRCCKCCCCKKKEPTVDVTKCSIYGPLLLVLACMIAVMYGLCSILK